MVSGDSSLQDPVLLRGTQDLPPVRPGEIVALQVALPAPNSEAGRVLRTAMEWAETVLHCDFVLKGDTDWAQVGHVVSRESLLLSPAGENLSGIGGIGLEKDESATAYCKGEKSLRGGNRRRLIAGFTKEGFLASLQDETGREHLKLPLVPHLYRVPTQNDGLKNFMDLRGKKDFAFYYENKVMYGWLDAGLDKLRFESLSADEERGRYLCGIRTASGREAGCLSTRWVRESDSVLRGCFTFDLTPELGELGRLGFQALLEPFDAVQWFGLGPQEAYSDRRAGARLGRWQTSVPELLTPYILPQENGNRHGARWLQVQGLPGGTFLIGASVPFDFSVSPYSDQELWEARHWDALPEFCSATQRGLYLNLDAAQRGVGTATCGPDTLDQYRLYPGIYLMDLVFMLK